MEDDKKNASKPGYKASRKKIPRKSTKAIAIRKAIKPSPRMSTGGALRILHNKNEQATATPKKEVKLRIPPNRWESFQADEARLPHDSVDARGNPVITIYDESSDTTDEGGDEEEEGLEEF